MTQKKSTTWTSIQEIGHSRVIRNEMINKGNSKFDVLQREPGMAFSA